MKTYIQLLVSFVLLSIASSCKKSEDPAPQSPVQSLTLRMNPTVGDDTLKFNSSFTTENNVRYTVSSFRYYMSDIRLIKSDGSEHALPGKVFLVNPNTRDYSLGDVPVGDYKGIRFSVGLNNVVNHLDPTTYPISHPLAIQSPAIHWSWNTGYIFLMLEGSCDVTPDNDDVLTYGQYSQGLFYHIGMDALLRTVDADNKTFTVSSSTPNVLNIQTDINKLFIGVDMKTENKSHTMGTMALATKIADNIPDMFTIK
jgi:hypothetical protein